MIGLLTIQITKIDLMNMIYDVVYQNYYDLWIVAVKSGLFGHSWPYIDLVKIWGHKPKQNVLRYVERVLCSVKETGMAVEINGSRLKKTALPR